MLLFTYAATGTWEDLKKKKICHGQNKHVNRIDLQIGLSLMLNVAATT